LAGDAAGLVNPLQGEGIAQALDSGRLGAEAILRGPGQAAQMYRTSLGARHLPYHQIAAALQKATIGHPRLIAALARLLVVAGRVDRIGGGWSVFWNELLDGAPPNSHEALARAVTRAGRAATAHGSTARWLKAALEQPGANFTEPASLDLARSLTE
jgi:flavin-dependent dehydrogenase